MSPGNPNMLQPPNPNMLQPPNPNTLTNPNVAPNPAVVTATSQALAMGEADPAIARTLLKQMVEGRMKDIGERKLSRMEAQMRKALLDEGLSEQEIREELSDKFSEQRSEFSAKGAEFDNKIAELKSKGATPEGAQGYDNEIHLLQAELYPTQLAALTAERADPNITAEKAAVLDAQIAQHNELATLKSERLNLKDTNGDILPDQVAGTISKMATDAERADAEENPIGYLRRKGSEAMRKPETRINFVNQLVAAGIIDESDRAELMTSLGQTDPKPEKPINKAAVGLGVAGLLMFLLLKMASSSAGGGQQQGGGHG